MKIDKVIFSSDDNPTYLEFWKIVSKICKTRLGIDPVLIHITNEDSELLEDIYGYIKKVKSVPNINTGYQAQNARFWAGTLFPEEICLTSDIDMLMLNKEYFVDQIEQYDDDSLIIYTSDAYGNTKSRFPICYNAAKGKVFKKILECDDSFSVYIKRLASMNTGWSFDEQYYTAKLKASKYNKIVYLNRGWDDKNIAYNRIDRVNWVYDENDIDKYIDCHSLRPLSKYKVEIENLLKLL